MTVLKTILCAIMCLYAQCLNANLANAPILPNYQIQLLGKTILRGEPEPSEPDLPLETATVHMVVARPNLMDYASKIIDAKNLELEKENQPPLVKNLGMINQANYGGLTEDFIRELKKSQFDFLGNLPDFTAYPAIDALSLVEDNIVKNIVQEFLDKLDQSYKDQFQNKPDLVEFLQANKATIAPFDGSDSYLIFYTDNNGKLGKPFAVASNRVYEKDENKTVSYQIPMDQLLKQYYSPIVILKNAEQSAWLTSPPSDFGDSQGRGTPKPPMVEIGFRNGVFANFFIDYETFLKEQEKNEGCKRHRTTLDIKHMIYQAYSKVGFYDLMQDPYALAKGIIRLTIPIEFELSCAFGSNASHLYEEWGYSLQRAIRLEKGSIVLNKVAEMKTLIENQLHHNGIKPGEITDTLKNYWYLEPPHYSKFTSFKRFFNYYFGNPDAYLGLPAFRDFKKFLKDNLSKLSLKADSVINDEFVIPSIFSPKPYEDLEKMGYHTDYVGEGRAVFHLHDPSPFNPGNSLEDIGYYVYGNSLPKYFQDYDSWSVIENPKTMSLDPDSTLIDMKHKKLWVTCFNSNRTLKEIITHVPREYQGHVPPLRAMFFGIKNFRKLRQTSNLKFLKLFIKQYGKNTIVSSSLAAINPIGYTWQFIFNPKKQRNIYDVGSMIEEFSITPLDNNGRAKIVFKSTFGFLFTMDCFEDVNISNAIMGIAEGSLQN